MGLTGAGGALVAIPLFMQFLGMSLKVASVYSLLAVVIASFSNFVAQRSFTNYKTAFLIVLFSGIGSLLSTPYKKALPDWVMIVLIILVSLFATYSVWFGQSKIESPLNVPYEEKVFLSIPVGIFLGILTTFTGLGGGVLMMPVFLKLYSLSQERAVATSLLAIALSSLISLLLQVKSGFQISLNMNVVYLVGGILASAYGLKAVLFRLPIDFVLITRKSIFTVVVLLAILKMF